MTKDAPPNGANDSELIKFTDAIEENTQLTGKVDGLWDNIVDHSSAQEALQNPGFVWESKLAILALYIDQLKTVVSEEDVLVRPFIKALLRLPTAIAVQRIGTRENRQVTEQEVIKLIEKNFNRFGSLYQMNGQSLTHDDLVKQADVQIETAENNPQQVVESILKAYMRKVALVHDHAYYTTPLLDELVHGFTVLKVA